MLCPPSPSLHCGKVPYCIPSMSCCVPPHPPYIVEKFRIAYPVCHVVSPLTLLTLWKSSVLHTQYVMLCPPSPSLHCGKVPYCIPSMSCCVPPHPPYIVEKFRIAYPVCHVVSPLTILTLWKSSVLHTQYVMLCPPSPSLHCGKVPYCIPSMSCCVPPHHPYIVEKFRIAYPVCHVVSPLTLLTLWKSSVLHTQYVMLCPPSPSLHCGKVPYCIPSMSCCVPPHHPYIVEKFRIAYPVCHVVSPLTLLTLWKSSVLHTQYVMLCPPSPSLHCGKVPYCIPSMSCCVPPHHPYIVEKFRIAYPVCHVVSPLTILTLWKSSLLHTQYVMLCPPSPSLHCGKVPYCIPSMSCCVPPHHPYIVEKFRIAYPVCHVVSPLTILTLWKSSVLHTQYVMLCPPSPSLHCGKVPYCIPSMSCCVPPHHPYIVEKFRIAYPVCHVVSPLTILTLWKSSVLHTQYVMLCPPSPSLHCGKVPYCIPSMSCCVPPHPPYIVEKFRIAYPVCHVVSPLTLLTLWKSSVLHTQYVMLCPPSPSLHCGKVPYCIPSMSCCVPLTILTLWKSSVLHTQYVMLCPPHHPYIVEKFRIAYPVCHVVSPSPSLNCEKVLCCIPNMFC